VNSATKLDELARHPELFFIDGKWVKPSSQSTITVISPITEEPFGRVAEAQAADIDVAVTAARRAFDHGPWPRLSHAERAEYLRRIATEMRARIDKFAHVWTAESGASRNMAVPGTARIPDTFDYYAGLADTFPFVERHKPQSGNTGLLVHEAVGVVGLIVPWNGPLAMVAWKLAPALLAGCTAVVKTSPEAPSAGLLMAEVVEAAGLPPGVVNFLTADREVSELLVRDPRVDKISFTGSTAAGRKIAAICGDRIARCTLELGGKSAAVILDDYDLETAANSISQSARLLTGQICSSLTRVIVSRNRHDQFAEALSSAFEKIRIGDPFDAGNDMGPLAMARQLDRVQGYVAKGVDEGAKLATGGARPSHLNRGYFIEPTVFANVDNAMAIAREEIFGPVVSVIPADSEQQAVDIANDTNFGLNASVFTNDDTRAYEVARQLRSGTVGQNFWRTDFSIAFGGFKQSGIGREGGVEGLRLFLESKTLILDGEPVHL